MKKALLITGKKAKKIVEEESKKLNNYFGDEVVFKVKGLQIEVAAFITKDMIQETDTYKNDYVIVPGTTLGDFSDLKNTYKGPKNATEIFIHLKRGFDELSPKKPLDELIDVSKNYKKEFKKLEKEAKSQLKIKDLTIGKEKPLRVAAEIVDSTNKSQEELKKVINRYEDQGADLIDLGVSVSANEKEMEETILFTKKHTELPVSVDTTHPDLIKKSIKLNIDLILSVTWENFEDLKEVINNQICVVAAKKNLNELINRVREANATPLADPILEPPNKGLMESLNRYYRFKKTNSQVPVFFGIGNVTEMIDADSVGVNAIMTSIASELECSILFTPQASNKTKNSIQELKKASKLIYLAKQKNTTPKDLGIDLLELKDKKEIYNKPVLGEKEIKAKEKKGHNLDKGYFEIGIDRQKEKIIATYYNKKHKPTLSIKGKEAETISDTIKEKGLIKEIGHALYLGRELKKAEISLKTNKNYIQEKNLF